MPNPFLNQLPTTAIGDLRGTNIQRQRLLRPYPQFDAVNTTTNEGKSWYDALQTGLQRRFSGGYTIGVNYTYSHFMEQIDFLNAADPEPSKVVSSQDAPHRMTVNGIVELPFGRGRRFGGRREWRRRGVHRRLADAGDLHVSERLPGQFRERPLHREHRRHRPAGESADGDAAGSTPMPDSTRSGRSSSARTCARSRLRLDSVRTDNVNNVDLSIIKNTMIAGKNLQFRFESLNALNHPLFLGAERRTRRRSRSVRSAPPRRTTTRAGRRSW